MIHSHIHHCLRRNRGTQATHYFIFTHQFKRFLFDKVLRISKQGWSLHPARREEWCFSIWVNKRERKVLTYEGRHVAMLEFPDDTHFQVALKHMDALYENYDDTCPSCGL